MKTFLLAAVTALVFGISAASASADGLNVFDSGCIVGAYTVTRGAEPPAINQYGVTDWVYSGADHWAMGINAEGAFSVQSGSQCAGWATGSGVKVGFQLWDDTAHSQVDGGYPYSGTPTILVGDPNTWCYSTSSCQQYPGGNDGYPCVASHQYQVWTYAYVWSFVGGKWQWIYGQVGGGDSTDC